MAINAISTTLTEPLSISTQKLFPTKPITTKRLMTPAEPSLIPLNGPKNSPPV